MARKRKWDSNAERMREKRRQKNQQAREGAIESAMDSGTERLQQHRLAIVAGGNPTMSTAPLDALKERGIIDGPQHEAGWRYVVLHRKLFPDCQPKIGRFYDARISSGALVSSYLDDIEGDIKRQQAFESADSALLDAGYWPRLTTRETIVYQKWPAGWSVSKIRRGLSALAQHWRLTGRGLA